MSKSFSKTALTLLGVIANINSCKSNFNKISAIQIINIPHSVNTQSYLKFCPSFQKYCTTSTVLISGINCESSLNFLVQLLKLCRRTTDSFQVAVFEKGEEEVKDSISFHNSVCKCLFSVEGSYFLNRGITNDIRYGLQSHAETFCNKTDIPANSSGVITIANQYSSKKWKELRRIDRLLLPTRNISASAESAARTDIQEFSTAAICLHLRKICEKPNRTINISSGIDGLRQGISEVVVYVLPRSGQYWEVDLSPAVYFDQLIFVILRQWKHDGNMQLANSFQRNLWISLAVCIFLVGSILLAVIYIKNIIRNDNYQYSEFTQVRFYVCFSLIVSLLEQPQRVFIRHSEVYLLLGCWFLVITSLTTAYKSILVKNLIKREQIHLPSTIEELLKTPKFRISHSLAWGMARAIEGIGGDTIKATIGRSEMVQNNSQQQKYNCLAYTLVDNFACLTLANSNKLDATILSTNLGLTNSSLKKIWHFSQRSTNIYAMWAYRRGFPLKEKFNDALGRISQAGLPKKWYESLHSMSRWAPTTHLNNIYSFPKEKEQEYESKLKKYIARNRNRSSESDFLGLKHIRLVFRLGSYIFCFSFLVFILEVVVGKCIKRRRQVRRLRNTNIQINIIISHYSYYE